MQKRVTEYEMVRWHHGLNAHEFEETPGDSEGQGSLVCCSPWGSKESDTTERLNTHTHTHNGILLSHKKEQNNAIYSNTDGPRDCHAE